LPKVKSEEVRDENRWLSVLLGEGEYDLIYYYGHTDNGDDPTWDLTMTRQELHLDAVLDEWSKKPAGHLVDHPVVILNSCRNLAFSGLTYHSFADFFAARGVSAVLGTESSVNPEFASQVGLRLLRELSPRKTRKSLGRILLELKREALKNGNPMILLYSLVGNSRIETCTTDSLEAGKQ